MSILQQFNRSKSVADIVTVCEKCKARQLGACSVLSDGELCELDNIVDHDLIEAKSSFIQQGNPVNSVYSVSDGCIRIYKLTPDGRRQIIGFGLPGDFIGLTVDGNYSFSVDAIVDTSVCRFDRLDFDAFMTKKPHLMRRLYELSARELAIMQEQLTLVGRYTAEERVASFILAMQRRWKPITGQSVTVPLPMQRIDIADYLGLTIETVSRTISKLARDKVILVVPEAVRILNDAQLHERAQH